MKPVCPPILVPCLVCVTLMVTRSPAQPQRAEIAYKTDFDAPTTLQGWTGVTPRTTLEADNKGGQGIKVEQPLAQGVGAPKISLTLPVETLRGTRLTCRARVKAQEVAQPPQPYNGVKFMLHIVRAGGDSWPQQNNVFGTFDWKTLEFAATIPRDTQKVELVLGLEATTGTVWFDDIALTVSHRTPPRPLQPPGGPVYTGHPEPRLRGAMINPRLSEADLRALAGWKANHIRWQLAWFDAPQDEAGQADLNRYNAWLDGALAHLDEMLPLCQQLGIKVLIDLHSPPGGSKASGQTSLFAEKRYQDAFLQTWEKTARRYKDQKAVWGYDLLNEPIEGVVSDGLMDWQQLATQAAQRVRAIDAKHALIVEPSPGGGPEGLEEFAPLPVPGMVYSVHMYLPHTFTHQGVHGQALGFTYPSTINGALWNKDQIRRALQPVREFQRDYNVQIYIGEFSAIRWAPDDSAYRYLRDCIEVFEEYGWDWAYHAFREWDGWSVEYGSHQEDTHPSETPTDRQQLLQSWFAKNVLAPPAPQTAAKR